MGATRLNLGPESCAVAGQEWMRPTQKSISHNFDINITQCHQGQHNAIKVINKNESQSRQVPNLVHACTTVTVFTLCSPAFKIRAKINTRQSHSPVRCGRFYESIKTYTTTFHKFAAVCTYRWTPAHWVQINVP